MNRYQRLLASLRQQLQLALPGRVVARDLQDHPQRPLDQLLQGVVTVIVPEVQLDPWLETLRLTLVGQLAVPERASSPAAVEDAELQLLQQLLAFVRNPGGELPRLHSPRARLSGQLEYPFGWVALELDCGPLDGSEDDDSQLYPPGRQPGQLGGVQLDIDLRGHESRDEHLKWLAGNYQDSQPDLSVEMRLHGTDQPETGP